MCVVCAHVCIYVCVCVWQGVGRPHVRRPLTSFEHPSIRLNSLRAVETPAIYRLTNTFNETPPPPSFSKKITYAYVQGEERIFSRNNRDPTSRRLPFYYPVPLEYPKDRRRGEEYRPNSKLSEVKSRRKVSKVGEVRA